MINRDGVSLARVFFSPEVFQRIELRGCHRQKAKFDRKRQGQHGLCYTHLTCCVPQGRSLRVNLFQDGINSAEVILLSQFA